MNVKIQLSDEAYKTLVNGNGRLEGSLGLVKRTTVRRKVHQTAPRQGQRGRQPCAPDPAHRSGRSGHRAGRRNHGRKPAGERLCGSRVRCRGYLNGKLKMEN